jgi:hypothetical protein
LCTTVLVFPARLTASTPSGAGNQDVMGAADETTAGEHLEIDGAIVRRWETGVRIPGVGARKTLPGIHYGCVDEGDAMSFDLAFWYEDAPSTAEQALEIYEHLGEEGENAVVTSAPAVERFFAEVVRLMVIRLRKTWTSRLGPRRPAEQSSVSLSTSPFLACRKLCLC